MENIISYADSATKFQKKIIFNAGVESSIRYYEPEQEYCPKIQILISPFGLPFIPIEIVGTDVGKILTTMKFDGDRNNPGGLLTFTLAPDDTMIKEIYEVLRKFPTAGLYSKIWNTLGFNLEDLFKPMALCQLWIDGYHVMTGTVESCHRGSQASNDGHDISYAVTINELGNIYHKNVMRLDTTIAEDLLTSNYIDSTLKAINLTKDIKMIPVAEALRLLITAFKVSVLAEQGLTASDGFPLSFRLMADANPVGAIANLSYCQNIIVNSCFVQMSGQSFWDFLKNLLPLPWMEFFTESGGRTIVTEPFGMPSVLLPGVNYVVARSTPYTNPMIGIPNLSHIAALSPYNLSVLSLLAGGDFVIITDDDIIDKNIGCDCTNQATAFWAAYSESNLNPATSRPIKADGPLNPFATGGMRTFGFNEMRQVINCMQLFGTGAPIESDFIMTKDMISTTGIFSIPAWSNLLALWYRNQSKFREGQVTVKMKPWARKGMVCLYLPTLRGSKVDNARDIGLYYIDSFSHDYSLNNSTASATTTLNLIRGVPLPTSVANSALLLFDFEVLPPGSGLWDGEYDILKTIRMSMTGA